MDTNTTEGLSLQPDFQRVADGDSLTCVLPPSGGDFWPFGGNPSNTSTPINPTDPVTGVGAASSSDTTVGVAVGVILGVLVLAVVSWFVRKWAVNRTEAQRHFNATRRSQYIRQN